MKKSAILLIVLGLSLLSCERKAEVTRNPAEDPIVEMSQYNDIVYNNKDLLFEWAYFKKCAQTEKTRALDLNEKENYKKLKAKLLPSAIQFASDLGITKSDIEDMTEVKINSKEEMESALVGLMLFSSMIDRSLISGPQTKGGSLKDCFLEATGIATGVAIVGSLTKGTMTKKAIKAVLKVVIKAGTRSVSGVGLALLAAEIAWCMLRNND